MEMLHNTTPPLLLMQIWRKVSILNDKGAVMDYLTDTEQWYLVDPGTFDVLWLNEDARRELALGVVAVGSLFLRPPLGSTEETGT